MVGGGGFASQNALGSVSTPLPLGGPCCSARLCYALLRSSSTLDASMMDTSTTDDHHHEFSSHVSIIVTNATEVVAKGVVAWRLENSTRCCSLLVACYARFWWTALDCFSQRLISGTTARCHLPLPLLRCLLRCFLPCFRFRYKEALATIACLAASLTQCQRNREREREGQRGEVAPSSSYVRPVPAAR